MTTLIFFAAVSTSRIFMACRARMTVPAASLANNLISSATWSLRDLAVCSLPAVSPIRSNSRPSIFMCTSSRSSLNLNFPLSISARMSCRPDLIFSNSLREMIFCLDSISACTMLPSMSYL